MSAASPAPAGRAPWAVGLYQTEGGSEALPTAGLTSRAARASAVSSPRRVQTRRGGRPSWGASLSSSTPIRSVLWGRR